MYEARNVLLPVLGAVFVVHSGRDLEDNHHIHPEYSAQYFGYDLMGVDPEALRITTGDGSALDQWIGMGLEIVAPEAGIVEIAVDGEPDLVPGQEPDASNPGGNLISIRHDDGAVTHLAHLQKGSVRTELLNQRVQAGEVVGRLGNSGFSGAPHLHVHCQMSDEPIDPYGKPIDLHFTNVVRIGRHEGELDGNIAAWDRGFVPDNAALPLPYAPVRGDILQAESWHSGSVFGQQGVG